MRRCGRSLAWTIEYDPDAISDLAALDRPIRREIVNYLENRIATADNPGDFGKPLRGDKSGIWRYRVRDYRILCQIQQSRVVVLVVAVGHRRDIYNG